jgi:hypothetical protein
MDYQLDMRFLRENAGCFRRSGLPEVYRCFGHKKVVGEGMQDLRHRHFLSWNRMPVPCMPGVTELPIRSCLIPSGRNTL